MIHLDAYEFNKTHIVGTKLRYYPILGDEECLETKTRSIAWDVCGSTLVKVEGKVGGVCFDNLEIIRR